MTFKRDIFYRKQKPNLPLMYYFGYDYKDLMIANHLQFPLLAFVFKSGPKYKIRDLNNFIGV